MTHRELLEEIGRGGRFVTFLYAFSVVVLTFRRNTAVRFIRADGSGAANSAWGMSLLTCLVGWWGIPWGPIYSIHALAVNARGGRDVTREILAPVVGEDRAAAALKLRQKGRTSAGLWALRLMLLAIPFGIWALIAMGSSANAEHQEALARLPGHAEFRSAEGHVRSGTGGNTPAARQAATAIQAALDSVIAESITKGKAPHPVHVWVEDRAADAIVLIEVEDLRRFDREAQATLVSIAWDVCAASFARQPPGTPGTPLTVGVKGSVLWHCAMTGTAVLNPPGDPKLLCRPPTESTRGDIQERLSAAFARSAAK